ncbi:PaaI family thioesterase [Ramlibacter solisilvae]|uniref:Aromatic compound catabolic protein n=1 Tax=Ramlibacter tataouinensis TaxID=94132 RepID=A0A127JWD1_9BURK|nr:PaaI family thioesterase [Ramlibacter tataouinensis]AMO24297.1 aromatic compound catabolic protein [Ramlibacter tataouinensis]
MSEVNQLEAWLALEREVKARIEAGSGVGVARPEQVAGKSGLEMLQAVLSGEIPAAPISKTLDFDLIEVERGRVVFQGTPGPAHLNPMGGIHGGWYATLLDSALGCAVNTMLPPGTAYTTAELSVNLVRAIGSKAPRVRAEGKIIHCGRQLATAEARLYGPDGTVYAHGTTTCLVFELK